MRDQDLRYAVKVQDAQLKELSRNIRALNRDISASERAGATATATGAAGYDRWEKSAKRAAGSSRLANISMKDAAKFGVASTAGFVVFEELGAFLRSSVPAALESERSLTRLDTQLKAVGLDTDVYAGKVENAVHKQTLLAGVIDDELVRDSLTNLLRTTRNVTTATELNALALDIAIAKNISLETASRLVARVYAGNTGALGRYGIVIDRAATSTEALAILQARFGGQAAAAGETAEGKFGRFHYRVEELKETLGSGLVPTMLEVADAGELVASTIDKIPRPDITPGFDGSGISAEVAKFARRQIFLGPATLGLGPLALGIADQFRDGNEELEVTNDLAANVSDTFDRLVGRINKVGAALQDKLRGRMLDALDAVEDKALDAFDEQTDAMITAQDRASESALRAFDKRTETLLENMRTVVTVAGRTFEIGAGELTPAERELEALTEAERKRNAGRDLFDAREDLGQALLIGDPEQIRQAKRNVEDAETERKKITVEARAETEREAADKALAEEEDALRESRDAQRRDLEERNRQHRDHLSERREQMRENLQKELAAQREALKNGKRAAQNAQVQILATLRRFGADYKGVGKDLGGKFLEGFRDALNVQLEVKPSAGQGAGRGFPRRGAARGGIAGQLGVRGPSDTVPAWLTPGEMILTAGDQRLLAQTLGSGAIGWPLLGKIRMGFAQGGVVDDDLLRMLLQRFSGSLADDAVARGTALADPRLLKGGLSAAEARALSPVHVQSLVKKTLGPRYATLDRSTKLSLLGELAQRQAHPVRAGLISPLTDGGYRVGNRFRDPVGSVYAPGNFSMGDINVAGGHSNWGTAQMIRRELIKHGNRNARRHRGRNSASGSRVGLA